MKPARCFLPSVLLALLALVGVVPGSAQSPAITAPDKFFGFELGADRKLARWDRIVEYFELLDQESERIQVLDLGPTTDGHPFLLAIISSAENLAQLERLREINLRIQDPETDAADLPALLAQGKAVVSQSLGLHSTEVAGAQTAPELAYDLVARDDPEATRIRNQVITLLFPCFNPDGQVMVADWYRETLGGEHEGVGLPWLYHRYAGHDNNRDGDFLNLIESRYIAKVLYRDWKPQAYVDHHQMGSYGARIFVPPYSEPIRPGADPLIWRELSWYGAHIAYKLEERGVQGVLNAGIYPGWGHFGWHWITPFHNIAGMLTESASASLATPLLVHPEQLRGGAREFPNYEAQSTMPSPWPGGWWRQRDIVEQQKIAGWAILDIAARNRETVLESAHLKAKRQTERGAAGSPKGYVIPAKQHDPLTASTMIDTLLLSDIQIHRATSNVEVDGRLYGAGSYLVSLAQPKTGLVRNLLGRTLYPDNEWTRDRDEVPLRPYDTATHTMAELMGVTVDEIGTVSQESLELVAAPVFEPGEVSAGRQHRLDGRQNASFRAVNQLLAAGIEVARVRETEQAGLAAGDFVVRAGGRGLAQIAAKTGVDFSSLEAIPENGLRQVEAMRIGVYQRYRGGNMDEGWTRLVLEQFDFPYETVRDARIVAGDLSADFDVLVIPDDSASTIKGDEEPERPGRAPQRYPPEYMTGLGEDGAKALAAFVDAGGTLVALGDASAYAIEIFELEVRNVVDGIDRKEFYCPGSTLRVSIDNSHPLALGMPDHGLVLNWGSPAFEIEPSRNNDHYQTVVRYADRELLQSGWLIGERHLAKKAAMVSARQGKGRVVLIGFRTQHRAQTHGTYKLLFNALLGE